MKNLAKIFTAVVAGMFALSCVQDTTEDLGVKVENQAGVSELTLSLEQSRTHLGEKADELYPLYWSEGDAISVNGVVSYPLEGISATATSANFKLNQEVTRPLCVVYPASAAVAAEEEVEEEVTPAPVVAYPVHFLATQPYTVGSFAPQAAPMYGYAAALAEGEEETPVQLNHLTGVIRLAIKGNGEKVTNIAVKAENGKIAGPFTVDCTNGTLTAQDGASSIVNVTCNEGLVLGTEATPVYVTVPAGNYGTFVITIATEAHGKMTLKFNSDVKPINVGVVREFAEFSFEANANDAEDIFLIDSEEALIEFANIAGTFYPRTAAKVVANLDLSGLNWKPIANFGAYEFDGGSAEGYTISGLTAPLFETTAANIKNVKLTNVNMTVTDLAFSGTIACNLYGSLDNCSAEGTINLNNTTLAPTTLGGNYNDCAHGGLVGMAHGATVTNSTNDIDITITSLYEEAQAIKSQVGGVVGGATDSCSFSHLTNNGDLTYVGTTLKANLYISGIVGKNNDADAQNDFVEFTNCTNNGNITTDAKSVSAAEIILAGITGRLEIDPSAVCDKMINTGKLTHNGQCTGMRLGGIVAYTSRFSLTNSSNSGNITLNTGAKATSAYLAGLVSAALYADKIENCTNSGNLYIGDGFAFAGAVQLTGLINTTASNTAGTTHTKMTNCKNSGSLYCGNCTNTGTGNGGRLYMGGVTGTINDTDMSNCVNEATGTLTAKTGAWASRYMIGGLTAYVGVNNANCPTSLITDCENKAAILVDPTDAINSMQLGGITCEPYINKSNDTYWLTMTRVKNSGNITINGAWTSSYPQAGGLIGINNHDNVVLKSCENSGNIVFNGTSVKACIGGIVGLDGNNHTFEIDGCINSGNIEYNSVATEHVRVGGFIGMRDVTSATTIKGCTNTGAITVADQTVAKAGYYYNIGGFVGWNEKANFSISNCINGSATDATKGAITLGEGQSGVTVSGIVGLSSVAITIDGCKNYGTVKQTKAGGKDKTNRASIAGILGRCAVGGIRVNNCENYGTIEYGTGLNVADARVDIAGIVAITLSTDNIISNCKNGGTIIYKAKKTNAGEVTVGGICGCPQSATIIENCTNLSTGLIHAAGSTTSGYDIGGIIGGPSGPEIECKGCKNYAEIRQTGVIKGATYIGGICGYGYSIKSFVDCENRGPINIEGSETSARKTIYAGGIAGWARTPSSNSSVVVEKVFKNCANYCDLTFGGVAGTYCAGAIAGYINNEDAEMLWTDISGLKNVGNITFSADATTKNYGGLIGLVATKTNPSPGALANITDCVFYGDIKALDMGAGTIGVILGGVARTADKFVVKNSQIGGNFIYSVAKDTDASGDEITVDVKTPFDLTMIYKTAITEAQAQADGCSIITTKPAVPAQ